VPLARRETIGIPNNQVEIRVDLPVPAAHNALIPSSTIAAGAIHGLSIDHQLTIGDLRDFVGSYVEPALSPETACVVIYSNILRGFFLFDLRAKKIIEKSELKEASFF